ncbi:MAG: cytochrome c biogenesis protein CcdA [Gemmatimonadales bacterium]|nr:MAG: cytochrome c biogenesis protein CcdA [Gemmatimonadales bacterium]
MTEVGIFVALMAGVLSFLSPCVLPLVPSYLSFVTGMSLEELEEGRDRSRTFMHAGLFVLGFTIVFVLLGASASFLGQFFRHYEEWVARIGGVIILVLGLHLAGVFKLAPLMRETRLHLADRPIGRLGAVAVGMAFGAGWTPCIGPVLGGILTYAMVQDTFWSGMGLLFVYSMGLAVPFMLTALALDRFLRTFQRFRRFLPVVQIASGVLLVILGILLISGSFTLLTGWLIQFTPDFLMERI